MPSSSLFPITHLSQHGPNAQGDVLFLASVPFDDRKLAERLAECKSALKRQPKYSRYELVVCRTSRRVTEKGEREFVLSRQRPSAPRAVSHERERDACTLNYVICAISKTAKKLKPTRAKSSKRPPDLVLDEISRICNEHGQQGDPTVGGNH